MLAVHHKYFKLTTFYIIFKLASEAQNVIISYHEPLEYTFDHYICYAHRIQRGILCNDDEQLSV